MNVNAEVNCDSIGVIRIKNNRGLNELLHDKNANSLFVGSRVKLVRINEPIVYGYVNDQHTEGYCLNIDIIDNNGTRHRYISGYTRKNDSNGFTRFCALRENTWNSDEYLELV